MKLIILLLSLFLISNIKAQTDNAFYFDVNRFKITMDNKGKFGDVYVPPDHHYGEYDEGLLVFSAGFLLSGYNADTLWGNGVAPSSLVEDYIPGKAGSDPNDPKNKIYVVRSGHEDFGVSWQEYKNAVELGADFYDGNNDGIYDPVDLNSNGQWDPTEDKPDILGDLTAWTIYNDSREKSQRRYKQDPLGIEIHQTVFGFSNPASPLYNTLFVRYRIHNTGTFSQSLDSVIFSMYADQDIGDSGDEFMGTDTILSSTFTYNDSTDWEYGATPPALYMTLLQNPAVYVPGETFIDNNSNNIYDMGVDTPLDTAINNYGFLIGNMKLPGAKNLSMLSTSYARNADPQMHEPYDVLELRNIVLGYRANGNMVDPCTLPYSGVFGEDCASQNRMFLFSGDPINKTGWINTIGANTRSFVNTGPFKLEAGKPVEIIVAYNAGRGTDNLNSIIKAKETAQASIDFYESNFTDIPTEIKNTQENLPNSYQLFQNYPNPFNPATKIKWHSLEIGKNTIKVYDILGNLISVLVDEVMPAGNYEAEFNAANLASGIYFYQLNVNEFSSVKKMIIVK